MAGWVNEEQYHMHTRVWDMALTHGCQFLAQVNAVLVFNVLDNCLPTVLVVDQVTIARRVNQVELQFDAVFNNDCVLECIHTYHAKPC